MYGLVKLIKAVVFAVRARKGGWIVVVDGDGTRREGVWRRKSETWGAWWRRMRGKPREREILEVDGGTGERGWWTWLGWRRELRESGGREERRALLG